MKRISIYLILFIFVLAACTPEIEEFSPTQGEADLSNFVAVGNSLTAGFTNGELYLEGQKHAFPKLMAEQMALAGGGDFNQPLMVDGTGFGNRLMLGIKEACDGEAGLAPVPYDQEFNPENMISIAGQGPFNNFGVPGAKIFHLLTPLYSNPQGGNPYFARFASNPGNVSVMDEVMATNFSFFSLWIGSNDVLGYAVSGGENTGDSITSGNLFQTSLFGILTQLTSNGAKGVISTVPEITNIPFFNTVPYNALVIEDEATRDALNLSYEQLGITFELGPNPFIIEDQNAPGGVRQIKENEYVLLTVPQDSIKCAQWGSAKPIPHYFVLDEEEAAKVEAAVDNYNGIILSVAQEMNLALADVNEILSKSVTEGLTYDGIDFSAEFITGGLFSVDGIHLSKRGNAIIANHFIMAINAQYNAQIPRVTVSEYQGIPFP
ncbi:MAG: hypothetical protein K9I94_04495 [Bacteroidales bacterium]|nr:hypothetical protein [Bacteroidales bacterium]